MSSGERDEKMFENQQSKELMEKLTQVDTKLEALSTLLADQPAGAPDSGPAETQGNTISGPWGDTDDEESVQIRAHEKDPLPRQAAISSSEAESIVQRMEKVNRDAEVVERVERLERQTRKIVVLGSLVMSFVVLVLAVYTVFLFQANLSKQGVGLEASQRGESPIKPPVQEVATKADEIKAPEPAPQVTEPTLTERQPAGPVAAVTAPPPAAPMQPVSEAKTAPVVPAVKYVGSNTSNKYHYPDCKWAAKIHPKKLRTFSSVKAARKQGYISCPTCGPPRQDP
jgi:hypothetical protein